MKIILFAGPTIGKDEIQGRLDADIRPPAQMGDIYLAAQSGPSVIGLIDGYFQGAASVWHKEILWAIDRGIAVFGASSMGALRAAELSRYGMTGVGKIFEAYRDGSLQDDDEVAVLHGPAELGYPSLCEPMVNIRATLKRAVAESILDERSATNLLGIAKSAYYPDRKWGALLEAAARSEGVAESGQVLGRWLEDGRVDQKKEDALALLDAVSDWLANETKPAAPTFAFEWTVMWDRLVKASPANQPEAGTALSVLNELRLKPTYYREIRRRAVGRFLLSEADGGGNRAGEEDFSEIFRVFRERHGLYSTRELKSWCERNGLDETGLRALIEAEARIDALGRYVVANAPRFLLSELKIDGTYEGLAHRAELKSGIDPLLGNGNGEEGGGGYSPAGLRLWYFETCLDRPLPESIDEHLGMIDIEDPRNFDSMVAREYFFRQGLCRSEFEADEVRQPGQRRKPAVE